jgi:VanZ family protein
VVHPAIPGGEALFATNKEKPSNLFRWMVTSLVTALLVVLLLQPGERAVTDTGIMAGPPSLARDLFFITGHIVWFTLLVVLWRWTLITRFHPLSALLLAVLIAFILGTSTEFAQRLIPGRGATLEDWLSNVAGMLIGVGAVRCYERRKDDTQEPHRLNS